METLWFWLVAIMIAAYVILDGFDLGVGIVHLGVARTSEERTQVLQSIGPVWDGNEVWLLAGGGTLYFAFPVLYAASFSGFYLPLMAVLWLLILRGISIEFRNHIANPVWQAPWDVVFCFASALLAIFFGAALGNVIRGVPLNEQHRFFLPFWTDFSLSGEPGILDWYTVTVGLLAFLTLTHHGSLWVVYKTPDPVATRGRHIASIAWYGVALLTGLTTIFTFNVQPQISRNLAANPVGYVFALLAICGLAAAWWFRHRRQDLQAFLASCAYIAGMLVSAAFTLFPYVLPATTRPEFGLTVYNAAAAADSLRIGLYWWIPGFLIATGYFVFLYRMFAGKIDTSAASYK